MKLAFFLSLLIFMFSCNNVSKGDIDYTKVKKAKEEELVEQAMKELEKEWAQTVQEVTAAVEEQEHDTYYVEDNDSSIELEGNLENK